MLACVQLCLRCVCARTLTRQHSTQEGRNISSVRAGTVQQVVQCVIMPSRTSLLTVSLLLLTIHVTTHTILSQLVATERRVVVVPLHQSKLRNRAQKRRYCVRALFSRFFRLNFPLSRSATAKQAQSGAWAADDIEGKGVSCACMCVAHVFVCSHCACCTQVYVYKDKGEVVTRKMMFAGDDAVDGVIQQIQQVAGRVCLCACCVLPLITVCMLCTLTHSRSALRCLRLPATNRTRSTRRCVPRACAVFVVCTLCACVSVRA
jgi:hypothetical protein